MSRIIIVIATIDIDKNHCYDLKWSVIIMSRIIAMVYIDNNHCHDLKRPGVIIMPRVIAMILTEELKLLLWFKLAHKMV